ncbi:MAG: hypothetical protein B6U76_02370 [Desulfurococcales archaeon ex4484_217_2]|nr:MAG: hypothetical protein B6U76_02370 [Desulfurococcales archaeon ex4484_217_2]
MEKHNSEIQLITFKLGENVYAVDVRHVREVVSLRKIVKLPRAPPYIEGIMNLRGRIVTLVNLASYLGVDGYGDPSETNKGKVLIFTLDNNRDLGFIVDHVLGVLRVKRSSIEKPASATDPSLEGVIKTDDGGIIIVLNIPHLVKELNLMN